MFFSNTHWPQLTAPFYSILYETSICRIKNSKFSPLMPDEVKNTWQEIRDHSFIQNHSRSFRFTAPCWCFISSVLQMSNVYLRKTFHYDICPHLKFLLSHERFDFCEICKNQDQKDNRCRLILTAFFYHIYQWWQYFWPCLYTIINIAIMCIIK